MTEAIVSAWNLLAETERLLGELPDSARTAETLIVRENLRVVLIAMRAGARLSEHHARGPITIQPISGRFSVSAGGEAHDVDPGSLLALAVQAPHAVACLEDGAFLLSLGWPGGQHEAAGS